MKKLFNLCLLLLFSMILLVNFSYASNVIHNFSEEKWQNILREWKIQDTGLDTELNDGPGYELLKEKYQTNDFDTIFQDVDKNYGQKDETVEIIQKSNNTKFADINGEEIKLSIRDRMIEMQEDGENKKEEKRAMKDGEDDEKEKGSMKVRINITIDKKHPNNPTPGTTYTKVYIFYTDCESLGDVLRENDLTGDEEFLNELDGIEGNITVDETYSSDFMHGIWKGYSWMLYKNGKQTNVGMDSLPITDGCSYRIKAEYQEMSW